MTGATGFLGSEIVHQAPAAGFAVRALARNSERLPADIDAALGDVRNPRVLREALDAHDAVVHAAGLAHGHGKSAADYESVNVGGTENLIRAAASAGVRRFVLVSSVSVYGESTGESRNEESPCRPSGRYASSKYGAERVASRLGSELGLDLIILRCATIYGEGDPGNVALLIRGIDRRRFVMPGAGENRKSLLHRKDAARACLDAVRSAPSGVHVYNVVGSVAPMSEIVGIVARRLGRRPLRIPLPGRIVSGLSRLTGNDRLRTFVRDDLYDGSRFETEVGFRATVPLEEGLNREVDWYRSRRN